MIIFKKAKPLTDRLTAWKGAGKRTGFVPTMGALHDGHLSLIRESMAENDLTVCSIFINPTQFNNADDFARYPVTLEQDIEQLTNAGCSVLLLPPETEVYPAGYVKPHYDLGPIETVLEGYYRPGHFQGVCQVVDRLLQMVAPDRLYLGQKDYQQCMVVRKLLQLTGRTHLQLRIVSTKREAAGLAMSSRNLRLDSRQREKAAVIYSALNYIKTHQKELTVAQLKEKAAALLKASGFTIDYVEIADAGDLTPCSALNGQPAIALVAATIGSIRLIDNLLLN